MLEFYILFVCSIFLLIGAYLIYIGKEKVIFKPKMTEKEKKIAMIGFLFTGLVTFVSTSNAIWFG